MDSEDQGIKVLFGLNRLKFINEDISRIELNRKEISEQIINLQKSGKQFSAEEVDKYIQELSSLEKQKFLLESERDQIVKEIKVALEKRNAIAGSSKIDICQENGIVVASGLPGIGKTETLLKIINSCNEREKLIIALRDKERITKLISENKINARLYFINPVYTKKKMDIKNINDAVKISSKLANDINKTLRTMKDPIILIHRSNDVSLDRINEISNAIKEEFWYTFTNTLNSDQNKYLIIFNCDDLNNECFNLLSFSDFYINFKNEDGNININFGKIRL